MHDRYITEFRWFERNQLTDWQTPEDCMACSLDEASSLISEYSDQDREGINHHPADGLGTIRVTFLCADTGSFYDVTEEAIEHHAKRVEQITGSRPWWLRELLAAE